MYLFVCATSLEMEPLIAAFEGESVVDFLIAGIGPVETTLALTRFLEKKQKTYSGVINFGIAGAYFSGGADLLDVCLANQESFGDFGIASGDDVLPFEKKGIFQKITLPLNCDLLEHALKILALQGFQPFCGNFVTVNSVTGTRDRGNNLQKRFDAICENMEGAAVVRVCNEFELPCLEVRCVSNLVDDRDPADWKLAESIKKGAECAAILARELPLVS